MGPLSRTRFQLFCETTIVRLGFCSVNSSGVRTAPCGTPHQREIRVTPNARTTVGDSSQVDPEAHRTHGEKQNQNRPLQHSKTIRHTRVKDSVRRHERVVGRCRRCPRRRSANLFLFSPHPHHARTAQTFLSYLFPAFAFVSTAPHFSSLSGAKLGRRSRERQKLGRPVVGRAAGRRAADRVTTSRKFHAHSARARTARSTAAAPGLECEVWHKESPQRGRASAQRCPRMGGAYRVTSARP